MKQRTILPAALLLSVTLAACGQSGSPTAHTSQVLTLTLQGNETPADLRARYGGEIVAFKPQAHLAIVRTDRPQLQTLGLGSSSETNEGRVRAQAGAVIWTKAGAVIWTKAGAVIWTKAPAVMWTKAGAVIWTKATFEMMPENSGNWVSAGLDAAQTRLTHLGSGVKVAVIDTGADTALFAGSLAPQSEWRDWVDGDTLPDEPGTPADAGFGHGTGITSTILQMSPGATILPLRVLGTNGGGDVADVAAAIVYAADSGSQVINLSLGTSDPSPAIEAAIQYAESLNVLVVTSSGNDGATQLDYPARGAQGDPQRLAVGSVGLDGTVSAFSNTGAGLSVFAPGEGIYSPAPQDYGVYWSGTSQSAAVVTGALALGLGEQHGPAQTRAALLSSTASVPGQDAGRLNLAAYSALLNP